MKNLKLLLAGLMVVSFAACGSSGGDHDGATIKEEVGTNITIIKSKDIAKQDESKKTILNSGDQQYVPVSGSNKIGIKNGSHTNLNLDVSGNNNIGMSVDNNGQEIKNNGGATINFSGDNGVAMKASNHSTATNIGTINFSGEGIAMLADGSGSKITNNGGGKITLSGENSVGMFAINGAQAINNGDIYITGHNNIGMLASGKGSEIKNTGTIHLRGTGSKINPGYDKTGDHELGRDKHGNVGMVARDHGRIINNGHIVFDQK